MATRAIARGAARAFSSKRRTRYGGEREGRAADKLLSFARRAQRSQLDRLRASLALEAAPSLPAPAVVTAATAANSAAADYGDEMRARRLKAAKQARAQHLPLFKPGSALLRHFGERTLGSFAHLPTTEFDGQVLVIHSPQEEAIYAPYLRAQKVRVGWRIACVWLVVGKT